MRTGLTITLLVAVIGCTPEQPKRSGFIVPAQLTEEEARVVAIAQRYISTNRAWADVEFYRPKKGATGGWSVLTWKLPAAPEGDLTILIDDNGHVTRTIEF